jgi:hypothetical protein
MLRGVGPEARISFDRGSDRLRKLWAVFACGGTLWFFAAAGAETGGYGRPSRSPDGRRLAMEVTDRSGQEYLGLRPGMAPRG